MIRVLAFSLYGPLAASHRVRLSQYKPRLAEQGIDLHIQSLLDDKYLQRSFAGFQPSYFRILFAYFRRILALTFTERFDLVIVYGDLLPFIPGWLERLFLRIPFIYDFDDSFHYKYRFGVLKFLKLPFCTKADRLMAKAVAVTAGNSGLAAYAKTFNPNVFLLPSVVDSAHFRPTDFPPNCSSLESFTVGWIGSPSTSPYLQLLVNPLERLAKECSVRLLVVGGSSPVISGVEVIEAPWSIDTEVSLIQKFDVGVMPLPDNEWTRGKCAYKLIQSMSCGIPVVASPVGANIEVVPPECGFLPNSSEQWFFALRQLASDPLLRLRLGGAARHWVEQNYSIDSAAPLLNDVIKRTFNDLA